uniref:Uncharacterized protein n=1 Tax=Strombidium rassoulzadegani TaxID=1082188 RepID=A0A7S3FRT3_9SPIT|mmetsp:Transcript_11814/g.19967  ORF Transcript_11814/g.19967 Transcript_11814/m.19967 type:complete len:156 (+) Transcript_11814:1001-1468(+)
MQIDIVVELLTLQSLIESSRINPQDRKVIGRITKKLLSQLPQRHKPKKGEEGDSALEERNTRDVIQQANKFANLLKVQLRQQNNFSVTNNREESKKSTDQFQELRENGASIEVTCKKITLNIAKLIKEFQAVEAYEQENDEIDMEDELSQIIGQN